MQSGGCDRDGLGTLVKVQVVETSAGDGQHVLDRPPSWGSYLHRKGQVAELHPRQREHVTSSSGQARQRAVPELPSEDAEACGAGREREHEAGQEIRHRVMLMSSFRKRCGQHSWNPTINWNSKAGTRR